MIFDYGCDTLHRMKDIARTNISTQEKCHLLTLLKDEVECWEDVGILQLIDDELELLYKSIS